MGNRLETRCLRALFRAGRKHDRILALQSECSCLSRCSQSCDPTRVRAGILQGQYRATIASSDPSEWLSEEIVGYDSNEPIATTTATDPRGRETAAGDRHIRDAKLIHLRLLGLCAVDEDDLHRGLAVVTLRRLVLLHMCVQEWFVWGIADNPPFSKEIVLICACGYTLALCTGWRIRWSRAAFAFALGVSVFRATNQFPVSANHHFLELGVLALGTLFDDRRESEAELLLQSCRWLVVLVLFWAGLQKVLHGYYFGGEFLSYAISQEARFAQIFGVILPADEMIRLQSYGRPAPVGAGPFRSESWALLIVSNATYLAEIGVAIGLLVRRLRPVALCAAMALIVAIEIVAREVLFGALYLGLITLFSRRALNWRLLPMFTMVYAYLLAAGFGYVPTWGAH